MIFKNENVIEDMTDIMLQFHNYVPTEHHTAVNKSSGCEVSRDVLYFWWGSVDEEASRNGKVFQKKVVLLPKNLMV